MFENFEIDFKSQLLVRVGAPCRLVISVSFVAAPFVKAMALLNILLVVLYLLFSLWFQILSFVSFPITLLDKFLAIFEQNAVKVSLLFELGVDHEHAFVFIVP